MAIISKGPKSFFRVGPAESGQENSFSIQQGAMKSTRYDVDFHHPEFRALYSQIENLPNVVSISAILSAPLVSGFAAGKDDRALSHEESVPQIRPTQVLPDGELEMAKAYGIRRSDIADSDYIQDGEVLFNNTNSTLWVGKSAVIRGIYPAVCSNHITRLRIKNGIEPEFVALVLNLFQRLGYFAHLCTKFNNQAGVNTAVLEKVRIPLPSGVKRENLLLNMSEISIERKAKLAKAEMLLTGLDDYLLNTLGLAQPQSDTRESFAISKSDLGAQTRLNADYFHPERILTVRSLEAFSPKFKTVRLEQVVNFVRDQIGEPGPNYLSLANVQSNTGELVPADELVTGACALFRQGDVLFARLRPYLNKVLATETNGCCSPEFHVLRVKDRESLNPDYLAAILRSSITLAQTRHMMTGNTHPSSLSDLWRQG